MTNLEAQQRYFSHRANRKTLSCLFLWGIAQLSRDTLQTGVSHKCASDAKYQGGIAPFWASANLP